MSKPVTCNTCGRMVDDSDTVEMPNGYVCDDPCYRWLERLMEEAEEVEEVIDFDDYLSTEDDD